MATFLKILRELTKKRDRERAFQAECAAVRAALPAAVAPAFRSAMQTVTPDDGLWLGTSARDSCLDVSLSLDHLLRHGHSLILGGSGSGKSRLAAVLAKQYLALLAREPARLGFFVLDHKSEFCEAMRQVVGELVRDLPARQANALLDRLVVVNPFSSSALVPFQILRPEPGVDAEAQAFECASLVNRLGGAELGVKQNEFTYFLLLLGIVDPRCISLPELAAMLTDLPALVRTAESSPHERVRTFFGAEARLPAASIDGVRARLHALLRLPSTRLMLGAKSCVSFADMLKDKILLIDVGSPTLGCEDIAAYWTAIINLRLTRAIFSRRHADAVRPVWGVIDEFQVGLAATGAAEHYERILTMARSRGVAMTLITQSLAPAARLSPSLPKSVLSNCAVQMLFRSSPEDARALAGMFALSGARRRPKSAPWEESTKAPFYTPSEERELLITETARLPARTFWFWNRPMGCAAELVRALPVELAPIEHLDPRQLHVLEYGTLARPIRDLEQDAQGPEAHAFRPVVGAAGPAVRGGATIRRRPRPPRGAR